MPFSIVRADSKESPWEPFSAAVWNASTPEEYYSAEKLFYKISKDGNKLPHDNLKFIWGLNRLASFNHNQGNFKAEESFLVSSFRLQEKKLGKKNPLLAEPLKQLASIWQERQEYTRAKQALERALKLIEDGYDPNHLMTINILENLVVIYKKIESPEKAILLKKRIIKQLSNALPASSPAKAVIMRKEAELLQQEGEQSKAVALQKSALNIYMKTQGPFHLARIELLLSLAEASKKEAKYTEAMEHFKSALAISENIKGVDHADLFPILIQMADNYQLAGKPVAGRPFIQRALSLVEKKQSRNLPEIASVTYALAENFRMNNQPDQSIPLYNRVISMLNAGDATTSPLLVAPLLAKSLHGLAQVYQTKGNIIVAESNNRRAVEVWVNVKGSRTKWAEEALKYHRELIAEMIAKNQPDFIVPTKKKDQIRLLQERLSNLGIDPGPIDGYSGPKTRKAIATYNTRMGLIAKESGKKLSFEEIITHIPPVIL